MHIEKLTLHSNDIKSQAYFFRDLLGFNVKQEENLLSIRIGASTLELINAAIEGKYHYCFLIPCNKIKEAKEWLSNRLDLIPIENNHYIAHYESWNAHSIYFEDGDGNIAELIARHDLQNKNEEAFTIDSFLCINEIGTPSSDIRSLDAQLTQEIGSTYWKGDRKQISTNGDQYGLFLLPNHTIKKVWYPTQSKVMLLPYSATIIQDEMKYSVTYKNEQMNIRSLK